MPSVKEENGEMRPSQWAGRTVAVVGTRLSVEKAVVDRLESLGASVRHVKCADGGGAEEGIDLWDIDLLREKIRGSDAVFCTIGKSCFEEADDATTWAMNVDGVKLLCLAMEEEGVSRLVFLSSILCLGRQTTLARVDLGTPYLSDDDRGTWERSLFRGEMEAWKMAERGIGVSTVCAGLIVEELRGPIEQFTAKGGHGMPPMRSGFATAEDVARAMCEVEVGVRSMCVFRNASVTEIAKEICPAAEFRKVGLGLAKIMARMPKKLAGRWMFGTGIGRLIYSQDEYETSG